MPTAAPRACPAHGCGGIAGQCPAHDRLGVTLICGPPCSGKTTLARRLAEPGDLVLDFDDIAARLGSPHRWHHDPQIIEEAENAMRAAMRNLREHARPAWVIRCLPDPVRRVRLARALDATVWVLNPGQAECRRRAQRDRRPPGTLTAIRRWYHNYRPSKVDTPCPELRPAPARAEG